MPDIKQLIEHAISVMTCPTCSRSYSIDEVNIKRFATGTYVLQVNCDLNHPFVSSTWITSFATESELTEKPIDDDHLIELHQALKRFKGDFKSLWAKKGKKI